MAFSLMEDCSTDAVRVASNRAGTELTISWSATHVRLSVQEAVDLLDAVATVLAEKASLPAPTTSLPCINLHRDENAVRAAADVREFLQ